MLSHISCFPHHFSMILSLSIYTSTVKSTFKLKLTKRQFLLMRWNETFNWWEFLVKFQTASTIQSLFISRGRENTFKSEINSNMQKRLYLLFCFWIKRDFCLRYAKIFFLQKIDFVWGLFDQKRSLLLLSNKLHSPYLFKRGLPLYWHGKIAEGIFLNLVFPPKFLRFKSARRQISSFFPPINVFFEKKSWKNVF